MLGRWLTDGKRAAIQQQGTVLGASPSLHAMPICAWPREQHCDAGRQVVRVLRQAGRTRSGCAIGQPLTLPAPRNGAFKCTPVTPLHAIGAGEGVPTLVANLRIREHVS